MIRRLAALTAASLLLLVVAVPVARAAPEMGITPPSGEPGDQLTAVIIGFRPGSTITLLWNAQPGAVLETGTADDAGSAVLVFEIPADGTPGTAVVRACGDAAGCPPGSDFTDVTIDVLPVAAVDERSGSWLPFLVILVGALVLGQVTRRRWTRTTETFKPPPKKKADHEFERPPEVGRPPWQDREP